MSSNEAILELSVPNYKEIPGPLGGVATEYEIHVVTTWPDYKADWQRDAEIIKFSVFKTYREIEDLHSRLRRKFPQSQVPAIGKVNVSDCNEKRMQAADVFLKALSAKDNLCRSQIFKAWLGYDPSKVVSPQAVVPKKVQTPEKLSTSTKPKDDDDADIFEEMKFLKVQGIKQSSSVLNQSVASDSILPDDADEDEEDSLLGSVIPPTKVNAVLSLGRFSQDTDDLFLAGSHLEPLMFRKQDLDAGVTSEELTGKFLAENSNVLLDTGQLNEDTEDLFKTDDSLSNLMEKLRPSTSSPQSSKPTVAPKPALKPKPSLPPKPGSSSELTIKPGDGDAAPVPSPRKTTARPQPQPRNAAKKGETDARSPLQDIGSFSGGDILNYIQQEARTTDTQVHLFD